MQSKEEDHDYKPIRRESKPNGKVHAQDLTMEYVPNSLMEIHAHAEVPYLYPSSHFSWVDLYFWRF